MITLMTVNDNNNNNNNNNNYNNNNNNNNNYRRKTGTIPTRACFFQKSTFSIGVPD